MSESPSGVLTEDMRELLSLFQQFGVEYLIVGAHAVNAYTEARMTKDLDIWVNPSAENSSKVYTALKEFGAPLSSVTQEDFQDESTFFILGVKPNRVDILKSIPGVEFKTAWPKRKVVLLDSLNVNVLGYQETLQSKLASGRPQDMFDADKLKKAKPGK